MKMHSHFVSQSNELFSLLINYLRTAMSRLDCISVGPAPDPDGGGSVEVLLLEPRPFRPFKSSEEYLIAMKEDLAEWLQRLYSPQLNIDCDNFMDVLEDGVVLCKVCVISIVYFLKYSFAWMSKKKAKDFFFTASRVNTTKSCHHSDLFIYFYGGKTREEKEMGGRCWMGGDDGQKLVYWPFFPAF